jgi:small GTP-binding protein
MSIFNLIRILLILAIGSVLLFLFTTLLQLTESLFAAVKYLSQAPIWFVVPYLIGILATTFGFVWLLWRYLLPKRKRAIKDTQRQVPLSEKELEQRVATAEQLGVDVEQARRELMKLRERRAAGVIFVSLFGEISSGKSSLIKALLPNAVVNIGAVGGTTRTLNEYHWQTEAGDKLILVDVPGTNEIGIALNTISRAEAQRAHLVLYVCDGDLSRSQWEELQYLLELNKPCVLVLNKTDRYTETELEMLKTRLRNRIDAYPLAELVDVQSGGMREALRILSDGSEELVTRPIPPQIINLQIALQRIIDEDQTMLEQLRDSAIFSLIANKLDEAETSYRRRKADEMVEDHTRKAMLGAMAAVAPGSDLLIQGYLGISLIRGLSDLYQVPVHKADRSRLLDLVQQQAGQTMTLMLAIAGNVLKAFPGIGTVAGGMVHAVAYGLVFRSLGKAVARSFETRGALHPVQTAKTFKETLGDEIEVSGREIAQLALRLAHTKSDSAAAN